MQQIHVPVLGMKYWVALCVASVFGANMGDFFAHDLGGAVGAQVRRANVDRQLMIEQRQVALAARGGPVVDSGVF